VSGICYSLCAEVDIYVTSLHAHHPRQGAQRASSSSPASFPEVDAKNPSRPCIVTRTTDRPAHRRPASRPERDVGAVGCFDTAGWDCRRGWGGVNVCVCREDRGSASFIRDQPQRTQRLGVTRLTSDRTAADALDIPRQKSVVRRAHTTQHCSQALLAIHPTWRASFELRGG
jgi:hypothetical protein